MSLSNEDARSLLEPWVVKYVETLNAARLDEMAQFYDANSVMIEKDKSCLFGKKAIEDSLKTMMTECGKTTMKIFNSNYQGVGDFIHVETDFEFHTEKAGVLKGRYIQIWRKDGNIYAIYHDEYQML